MTDRVLTRYSPAADMRERWPGWRVVPVNLYGLMTEVILLRPRRFLVERHLWLRDSDAVIAHCVAHLDLGHHESRSGQRLTVTDEAFASELARVRLDRPEDRP